MKFRKEILLFSLIIIFMLMSAVSAEENITIDDGATTSDNIEIDSNQDYNVSEGTILEDNVIDNISEDDGKADISPNPMEIHDDGVNPDFNVISKSSSAIAGAYSSNDFDMHKASSYPDYAKNANADMFNEPDINEKLSDFQSPARYPEALNDIIQDISGKNHFWQAASGYREYFNLKLDLLEDLIDENEIEDVFNGNTHIDFNTIDYLISFMNAGAKYADSSIGNLFDVNAFFDIFNKIMNLPATHNVMTNIPSSNDSALRNNKYYSNYGLYPDTDSIMNSDDLNDCEESFIKSDDNISDMVIILDNIELINQTSDLKTIPDVCIDDMKPDLQLSNTKDYMHDTYNNFDELQSLKLSQEAICLSGNVTEGIQHTFYHTIGCECTNTSFTKQYYHNNNLPDVSKSNTVTSTEKEENHDNVLFKKFNVNAPFIVENASVFALFGVIKITIP